MSESCEVGSVSKPLNEWGKENERLGRALVLCVSKHKSLGTMNNKSIEENKKETLFLWGLESHRAQTRNSWYH